jgi:mannose-1-phosphate guanylyltransferase
MNAMLLCAGLGTRFTPHTKKISKPAIPFLNLPILAYPLFLLNKLRPVKIVVNTHHLPETIEAAIKKVSAALSDGSIIAAASGSTNEPSSKFFYSYEKEILGSGGGINFAKSTLLYQQNPDESADSSLGLSQDEDYFVVINGDDIILFDHEEGLQPLIDFHKESGALVTLLTTDHPEAGKTKGGIWVNSSGQVTQIHSMSDRTVSSQLLSDRAAKNHAATTTGADSSDLGEAKHFTGVAVYSNKIFSLMPQGNFHIFNDCLVAALERGEKIMSLHDPSILSLEMTCEEDYLKSTQRALKELSAESTYGINLAAVFKNYDLIYERISDTQWLGPGAQCLCKPDDGAFILLGSGSIIGADAEISGFCVLGDRASFDQGYLESSVIAEGKHLHALEAIRQQLIL